MLAALDISIYCVLWLDHEALATVLLRGCFTEHAQVHQTSVPVVASGGLFPPRSARSACPDGYESAVDLRHRLCLSCHVHRYAYSRFGHFSILLWLRERVRNLLAAIDGADKNEQGASCDDETEWAC